MDNQEREQATGDNNRQPKLNPWLDIFLQPRLITRQLLESETASSAQIMWLSFTAFMLVIAFGIITFFPAAFNVKVTKIQLVAYTPLVFLLSWGYYLVSSYLFWYFGRAVGSQAELWQMKVVNSFTTVIPGVVFGLARLASYFTLGKSMAGQVVENAVVIWSIYITLAAVAEAARLSVWRALLVYVFTAGVLLAFAALLSPLLAAS